MVCCVNLNDIGLFWSCGLPSNATKGLGFGNFVHAYIHLFLHLSIPLHMLLFALLVTKPRALNIAGKFSLSEAISSAISTFFLLFSS